MSNNNNKIQNYSYDYWDSDRGITYQERAKSFADGYIEDPAGLLEEIDDFPENVQADALHDIFDLSTMSAKFVKLWEESCDLYKENKELKEKYDELNNRFTVVMGIANALGEAAAEEVEKIRKVV